VTPVLNRLSPGGEKPIITAMVRGLKVKTLLGACPSDRKTLKE
jgi:hypothetical protein